MNRDAIQKWIDALRSGEYKQCQGQLRKGNSFCATGVLCDVHSKEFNSKASWEDNKYLGNEVSMPMIVQNWINSEIVIGIITMNDGHRMGFNQIADKIEKKFNILKAKEDAKND